MSSVERLNAAARRAAILSSSAELVAKGPVLQEKISCAAGWEKDPMPENVRLLDESTVAETVPH